LGLINKPNETSNFEELLLKHLANQAIRHHTTIKENISKNSYTGK
jgi:hypothetical protein